MNIWKAEATIPGISIIKTPIWGSSPKVGDGVILDMSNYVEIIDSVYFKYYYFFFWKLWVASTIKNKDEGDIAA